MAQYKDEERGFWYCKFNYTDWTGQHKQKLKRGFSTKRDAAAWEQDFLERQQGNPDMSFKTLYDLYMEDISQRIKGSTVRTKKYTYECHIVPYFGEKAINTITPVDIRKWQNNIMRTNAKETYQRQIHSQLNAIFNFAVRYYGLIRNPHSVTGSIGKMKADRMEFGTTDEFSTFLSFIPDITVRTAFLTLYYTGIRCGELLALTVSDIDLNAGTISITKTHHRIKGKDVFTTPKTHNSIRTVTMSPPFD